VTDGCLFCTKAVASKRILENQSFYAIFDAYPVNPGHLLVIPKRHVPDLFGLDDAEFSDLRSILHKSRDRLDAEFRPDGFNIGANCAEAAGQTIPHAHIHVIPRYVNDVENPRGGVRNIKKALRPY
jgi:diadenosine tetraphosphate (Ap4A) HIT family hydrolase